MFGRKRFRRSKLPSSSYIFHRMKNFSNHDVFHPMAIIIHHPWPRDKPFLHRRFQFLAVDEAWEAPSAHGGKKRPKPTVAVARKAEWFHSQRPLATDKRIGIGKWSILTY